MNNHEMQQEAAKSPVLEALQGERAKDPPQPKLLIWIDMEMTGLDVLHDDILEVAVIVTNAADLSEVARFHRVLAYPEAELVDRLKLGDAAIAAANVTGKPSVSVLKMHTDSGLIADCAKSSNTMQQVEQELEEFLTGCSGGVKHRAAGNSVHFDLYFLRRQMPAAYALLHHQIVEVTSHWQTLETYFPGCRLNITRPRGFVQHRAMSDIEFSIEQYRAIVCKALETERAASSNRTMLLRLSQLRQQLEAATAE